MQLALIQPTHYRHVIMVNCITYPVQAGHQSIHYILKHYMYRNFHYTKTLCFKNCNLSILLMTRWNK